MVAKAHWTTNIIHTASVVVAEVREPPHVAQPHAVPQQRQQEVEAPRPVPALRLRLLNRGLFPQLIFTLSYKTTRIQINSYAQFEKI